MNLATLFRARKSAEEFLKAHPRIPAYVNAVAKAGVKPGDVVEIKFRPADGKEIETNFQVQETDMEFLKLMRSLMTSVKPS